MFRTKYYKEEEQIKKPPIIFYSKSGKKRLAKIWEDSRLSEELLFPSLTNSSRDSTIREKVNDYMQQYLMIRLQRFPRIHTQKYIYQMHLNAKLAQGSFDDNKRFQNYYAYKRKEEVAFNDRRMSRSNKEEARLPKLQHNEKPSRNTCYVDDTVPCLLQLPIKSIIDDGNSSRSSGFVEPTPSPEPTTSSVNPKVPLISSDSDEEDSLFDDEISSNETEQVCCVQGQHAKNIEEKFVELLTDEISFNWVSPHTEALFREKEMFELFCLAHQLKQVYSRKMCAATEFSNKLSEFMNSKMLL